MYLSTPTYGAPCSNKNWPPSDGPPLPENVFIIKDKSKIAFGI